MAAQWSPQWLEKMDYRTIFEENNKEDTGNYQSVSLRPTAVFKKLLKSQVLMFLRWLEGTPDNLNGSETITSLTKNISECTFI